jgi:hypothetical protein
MSQTTITAIVVVAVIIVVVIALLAWQRTRLRRRFGPEYDRAVDERGSTVAAERELLARERRYRRLDIKPLPEEARARYADRWRQLQEQFVDSPGDAVIEADQLVTSLMRDRGYETTGYDRQLEELSVEHAQVLGHYRAAHETSDRQARQEASTEDLRQAMVHYRALFTELLQGDSRDRTGSDNQPERR